MTTLNLDTPIFSFGSSQLCQFSVRHEDKDSFDTCNCLKVLPQIFHGGEVHFYLSFQYCKSQCFQQIRWPRMHNTTVAMMSRVMKGFSTRIAKSRGDTGDIR